MLLPCALIAILVPIACLCLPCFLRLARCVAWPSGSVCRVCAVAAALTLARVCRMHNPMGTKGAATNQINELPSAKFECVARCVCFARVERGCGV